MNRKQIVGLIVAAVLFMAIGVTSVLTNTLAQRVTSDNLVEKLVGGSDFNPPMNDYIALVKVEGVIQEQTQTGVMDLETGYQHSTTMDYIDQLMSDSNNKGILLYVDSPGGTVYESEELYVKLKQYKEQTSRPIWDYMSHYAASGGYMVSMAADKIYANNNTTTGSIGVIMSGYDLSGLYEKLGIRYFSITSGVNKDSSQLTEEQMSIYQTQVDEYYQAFVNTVVEGRGMTEEQVKALADGRTYTAKQAKESGLVDEIAGYDDTKTAMADELGTSTFYELEQKTNILSAFYLKAKSLTPKSEMQILTEAASKIESGVPMYYAEQLQ